MLCILYVAVTTEITDANDYAWKWPQNWYCSCEVARKKHQKKMVNLNKQQL